MFSEQMFAGGILVLLGLLSMLGLEIADRLAERAQRRKADSSAGPAPHNHN